MLTNSTLAKHPKVANRQVSFNITCTMKNRSVLKPDYWRTSSYKEVILNIDIYKYIFFKNLVKVCNSTHSSQSDCVVLEVPHFTSSVCKSTKSFSINFAHDAQMIWNDLPDDVRSTISRSEIS